jgi:hypothetical protein
MENAGWGVAEVACKQGKTGVDVGEQIIFHKKWRSW